MPHIGINSAYEVTLGPAAIRTIRNLPYQHRIILARVLGTELEDGPNADKELKLDCGSAQYTATPLSFKAYTAVHRHMTAGELGRLSRKQGRPVAALGFYVIEIRSAESAFARRPD
jgi:hypothetical protein